MNVSGQTACFECIPGSFCAEGASAPLPCLKGSYSSTPGLESAGQCTTCPAGSFCSTGSLDHTQCNPGTYADVEGLSTCELCNPGTYQPDYESIGCEACPYASYCPGFGSTSPTPCPGARAAASPSVAHAWLLSLLCTLGFYPCSLTHMLRTARGLQEARGATRPDFRAS